MSCFQGAPAGAHRPARRRASAPEAERGMGRPTPLTRAPSSASSARRRASRSILIPNHGGAEVPSDQVHRRRDSARYTAAHLAVLAGFAGGGRACGIPSPRPKEPRHRLLGSPAAIAPARWRSIRNRRHLADRTRLRRRRAAAARRAAIRPPTRCARTNRARRMSSESPGAYCARAEERAA